MIFFLSSSASAGNPGDQTTSSVFAFTGAGQPGNSTLVRTPNGLAARWASHGVGVVPGHAYTFWFVVFNEPEDCITPDGMAGLMCGESDVFVDPAPAVVDILFGGGAIAGNDGWIRLGGHRKRNDNSRSVYAFLGVADPPGLIDPHGAEVHLVLRSHGPAVAGMLADQIGSFEGGCAVFLDPPEIADEAGECADIHASIHAP